MNQMNSGRHGLRIMGTVEFIETDSTEYQEFLDYRHIDSKAFFKKPCPLPMMRVAASAADFFDASPGKQGYFICQHYDLK